MVIPDDAYGGTYRLFDKVEKPWGLAHTPAHVADTEAVAAAIRPGETKVVWVETPTNPLLTIADIAAIADLAHEAGALLVVDNTFASPYLQQPLTLGADVVVHSTTKYCGGHSDVVGGALVVRDLDVAERIAFHQNALGAVPGPFDCFLTHRGLKTLAIRMERHCDNAEAVVAHLESHPAVSEVIYPGLASHSGHEVASRQMKRYGGIVSFRVKAGEAKALDVCAATQVWTLGESLGGVESLIEHPGRMTHASVAGTDLEVPADLIRLSVGIETADGPRRRPGPGPGVTLRVCVDFGSTFTKACVVDLGTATEVGGAAARVVARTSHRTTVDTDVHGGLAGLPGRPVATGARSGRRSGPGLLVGGRGTAHRGRRQRAARHLRGRPPGGAVERRARRARRLGGPGRRARSTTLVAARPDVLLLAGGTDGGNAEVLLHNAARAGAAPAAGRTAAIPVVVAGNADAADEVASDPRVRGGLPRRPAPTSCRASAPSRPEPARAALREMFLSHVIGGKHLSAGDEFAAMVRGATPDLMLAAVELMAAGPGGATGPGGWGDVVVVDVGGATTDVYSVVEVDPESAGRDVVGLVPATRTVEGDLGMRWSAVSTVAEAVVAGFVPTGLEAEAQREAAVRQADPGMLAEDGFDLRLAGWAAAVAVRRHAGRAQVRFEHGGAGPARLVERSGTDLREVAVLVGSGGVLRHAPDEAAARAALTEHLTGPAAAEGGWQVPESPRVVLDRDYLLMPAGLLAAEHPEAAYALLAGLGGPTG